MRIIEIRKPKEEKKEAKYVCECGAVLGITIDDITTVDCYSWNEHYFVCPNCNKRVDVFYDFLKVLRGK